MNDPVGPETRHGALETTVLARIERAVQRARLVLFWEMLWPRLAPLLVLAAFFVGLSWLGVWREVGDLVRIAILAFFAAGAAVIVYRGIGMRSPRRAAALARVEAASGTLHRPATTYSDRLASGSGDPTAQALWAAHRTRLLAALDRLRAGLPSPGLARRDPYAIRFLAILFLLVAFIVAGPERRERADRSLPRRRTGRRDHCPHRCLGDAAGLYQPAADLPDRGSGAAPGHRVFRADRERSDGPCRWRERSRRGRPRRGRQPDPRDCDDARPRRPTARQRHRASGR